MRRRSIEGFSVALVGESSLEMQELMIRLDSGAVSIRETVRMGLAGPSREIGMPSSESEEGEFRELLPPLDPRAALERDLVFLGEGDSKAREGLIADAGDTNVWVVDLAEAPENPSWVNPYAMLGELRRAGHHLCIPNPAATLIVSMMPLIERIGVTDMVVHRFLPASFLGEAGVRELHAQAVGLLSFGTIPTEVLGAQWAFNLVPEASEAGSRRFESQLRSLWPGLPSLMTATVLSSMFHSTGASVALKSSLPSPEAVEIFEAGIRSVPQVEYVGADPPSAQDAVSSEKALLALRPTEDRWLWAWLVYDNVKMGRPSHAMTILETLTLPG